MANDLNQCNFIGRLGNDPATRLTSNGKQCTTFSIAVGSQWTDKNTGAKNESTEWINMVCWERTAEIAAEYLRKGSQVFVTGRFSTRKWEKDGQTHYTSEIIVEHFQMLGSRNDGQQEERRGRIPQAKAEEPAFDDEIPF